MSPDPFVMAAQRIRAGYPISAAFGLAQHFHAGQVDKQGAPYIDHPAAVARIVDGKYGDPTLVQIAYMHDLLEDTPVTAQQLIDVGFSSIVVDAVVAMTRVKSDGTYPEFIARVARNRQATLVKLADLAHNLDPSRPIPGGMEHLTHRYDQAVAYLENARKQWDLPILS